MKRVKSVALPLVEVEQQDNGVVFVTIRAVVPVHRVGDITILGLMPQQAEALSEALAGIQGHSHLAAARKLARTILDPKWGCHARLRATAQSFLDLIGGR